MRPILAVTAGLLVAALVAAGVTLAILSLQARTNTQQVNLRNGVTISEDSAIITAAGKAKPAVVSIVTQHQPSLVRGSGYLATTDGYIVTNINVIAGSSGLTVLIPGEKLPGCKSAGCDFSNTLFFNNTNELPLTDYHDFINMSRSVYNDKRDAVDNWVALYNAGEALSPGGGGNAAINRQILKSLRIMYPTVFTGNPKTEPPILATRFTTHIPAWYNLKQGALAHSGGSDSFLWSGVFHRG